MKAVMLAMLAAVMVNVCAETAYASGAIVISQFQPADSVSPNNEAVEIYNNTDADIDVTDWCLQYTSAANPLPTSGPKYCFVPSDDQTELFLSPRTYTTIVSPGHPLASTIMSDGYFSSSGMAATGGHVRLIDKEAFVVDLLGWGAAEYAEGFIAGINLAATKPSASQSLIRKTESPGVLIDTDNNKNDFELQTPLWRSGGVYEVRTLIDVCGNIPEIQEAVPAEYGYDEAGNCELLSSDACSNIDLVQLTVPAEYETDGLGSCYKDVCTNITGLQRDIPTGYKLQSDGCRALESRTIMISEILANVSGSDTGREFIELYNPHDSAVDISGYVLLVGKNLDDRSEIGADGTGYAIPPHGYLTLSDRDLGVTFANTESSVQLVSATGVIVSETSYSNPRDDQSWAYFSGEWQYTNRVTPGAVNMPMLLDDATEEVLGSGLLPCASGKYRHPITNRCRNIEADTSMLVACEEDEYRNPETNRCRKTATLAAALTPCKVGYERNLATNRCRKTGTDGATLTPCQKGYERNPATNRCKKSLAAGGAITTPASAASSADGSFATNLLLGTVGAGAVTYGVYEWRLEIGRMARRFAGALLHK